MPRWLTKSGGLECIIGGLQQRCARGTGAVQGNPRHAGCCGKNGGGWRGQAPCIWPDLWREGRHCSCGCHPEPWFRSGTATAGKEGCLHDPSMPRMNGSIQRFLEHRSESFDCRQRNDFCRQIILRAFIPFDFGSMNFASRRVGASTFSTAIPVDSPRKARPLDG